MQRARGMRQSGFTLLEILIAMVILAVLSALLVIAGSPSGATRARDEARRLGALLELAIAEARASGQAIAWAPVAGGYAFFRRGEDGEWTAFGDETAYRQRTLPDGIALRDVTVADHPLREGERIVLSPYGLAGSIGATLAGGSSAFALRAGPVGRVTLVPAQARDDARTHTERTGFHAG